MYLVIQDLNKELEVILNQQLVDLYPKLLKVKDLLDQTPDEPLDFLLQYLDVVSTPIFIILALRAVYHVRILIFLVCNVGLEMHGLILH